MIGMRFGNWTVMRGSGPGFHRGLLCECDCPNRTLRYVVKSNLLSGVSISCGCQKGNLKKLREEYGSECPVGKTFGKLRVIAPSDQPLYWRCRCSCRKHTVFDVFAPKLVGGQVVDCGCKSEPFRIMPGQVFGKLTVIREADRDNSGRIQWLCRCECGKERIATGGALYRGEAVNCEHHAKALDLTGQKFGTWTVLERVESFDSNTYWRCRCDCGKPKCVRFKVVQTHNLLHGKSLCCGCRAPKKTTRYAQIYA